MMCAMKPLLSLRVLKILEHQLEFWNMWVLNAVDLPVVCRDPCVPPFYSTPCVLKTRASTAKAHKLIALPFIRNYPHPSPIP
eukprot:657864-Amphidinium_carterae.1